jgi:P4 family phage/plasmid primase-like protien
MPNLAETRRFLQEVFPDHQNYAIFAHTTLPQGMVHCRDLAGLQPSRDCYWSIAAFPNDSVTNRVDKALAVRALVIDDVRTKVPELAVEMALGEPTAIVETSAGNFQWVYRLATSVLVDVWPAFFAGIEGLVGHKLDGRDAVHLFRLPMGINTKMGRNGFAVRLVQLNPGKVFNPRIKSTVGKSGYFPTGPGPSGLDPRIRNIKDFMVLLPNTSGYAEWIERAHQIKALAIDEEAGREAFHEWSSRWTGGAYDEDETEKKWQSIRDVVRTKGLVLLRDAEAADPAGFARVMNAEAGAAFDDGMDHSQLPSGGGYSLTHADMAAEIVRARRGDMGWMSNAPGHWAAFDPVMLRWEIEPHARVMRTAVREETLAARGRLAAAGQTKGLTELATAKWHGAVQSLLTLHAGLRIPFDRFDADPDMFGVPGGVVRLASGGVVEEKGSARQMVSRSMAVRPAPVGARGVAWEKFLDDFTMGDRELREWWQAFCGYCLTGRVHEHAVVFLYGPGGNGKSVFLDTLADVMGPYHERAGHALFMASQGGKHMAAVADLVGARLVTSPDVPVGCSWDLGLIKPLTGGGTFKAQFMRENWFKFTPQFKLVLAGNEKPELGGVDQSIRRRFWLVPAMYVPRTVNKQLVDVLKAERPAILRWMMDGWAAYNIGGLPPCKVIERETEDYLSEADVWGKWKATTLKKAPGDMTRHRVKDLWNLWDAYRAMEGSWKASPSHVNNFSTKLREAGFEISRDNSGSYVDQISITKSTSGVF